MCELCYNDPPDGDGNIDADGVVCGAIWNEGADESEVIEFGY